MITIHMAFRWLFVRRPAWAPMDRVHPYAVYEAFGIPSSRWLTCLTEQVQANHEERVAIDRYVHWSSPAA
jgi:hypothetical protein